MKKFRKIRRTLLYLVVLSVFSLLVIFFGLGLYGFPQQPKIDLKTGDREVTVLGSKMRYRDKGGQGPAVIFIHGNNLSLDYWEPIIADLPTRRFISIDLIGFGGSDRPDVSYDIECHRKYILAFMDRLGIKHAILVGHSMGGTIAAWTAAKSTDRIIGVVMISSPGVPGSLIYAWPKNLLCRPGIMNRVAFKISNSELFKYIFPLSLARQTLGVTNSYNKRFSESLYDIVQPAQLLMAPTDTRTPIEYSKVYLKRIENLDFEELSPKSKHMAPRSNPKGTAIFISRYLQENF